MDTFLVKTGAEASVLVDSKIFRSSAKSTTNREFISYESIIIFARGVSKLQYYIAPPFRNGNPTTAKHPCVHRSYFSNVARDKPQ
jgi:hypothetical protein